MDDPDQIAKYFTEYVNRGFRRIFEEQRRIAAAKIEDAPHPYPHP